MTYHYSDYQMALDDLTLANELAKDVPNVASCEKRIEDALVKFNWQPIGYEEVSDAFDGLIDEECDAEFVSELLYPHLEMQREMVEEYEYSEAREYANEHRTY